MINTTPEANTPEPKQTQIPRISFHNAVTGEIEERDMNEEEHSAYLDQQKRYEELAAEEQARIDQRQAILDKLGLTLEEFNLITQQ